MGGGVEHHLPFGLTHWEGEQKLTQQHGINWPYLKLRVPETLSENDFRAQRSRAVDPGTAWQSSWDTQLSSWGITGQA